MGAPPSAGKQRLPWLPLACLLGFFLGITAWLALHLPMREAPDELIHYKVNVRFILQHHRLPVTGEDDVRILRRCRDNHFGLLPCTNSYTAYPAMPYLVAAGSSLLWESAAGLKPLIGARMASVFWGGIYVICLYASGWLLTRNWVQTTLLTFTCSFVPQVLFVSSYINPDITGLAFAALCLLLTLRLFEKPSSMRFFALGVGAGLLCSSKYNYLMCAPLIGGTAIWIAFSRIESPLQRLKGLGAAVVGGLLFAGPWYLRNWLLYRDILGQNFLLKKMSEFHPLGHEWFFDAEGWKILVENHWFTDNARSFLGVFGYLDIFLDDWAYWTVAVGFISALVLFCIDLVRAGNRQFILASATLLIWFSGLVLLSMYHSLHIDFQAQGRYLFPVLPLTFALLCWLSRASTLFKKYCYVGSVLILIALLNAGSILGARYSQAESAPKMESPAEDLS